jgi:uncharacterized protein YrrD
MNYASQIVGFPVISEAEGSQLGVVSAVYLDTAQKRIAALGIRTRRVGGEDAFVPCSAVLRVGRNVVLISTEAGATPIAADTPPPGLSVSNLHGVRVTTMDGHHLGTVEDLAFATDWMLVEVALADNKALVIDPASLSIADEILVPADSAEKIRYLKHHAKGRGREIARAALRDTKQALKRAWSWRADDGSRDDSHEDKHL